MPEPRGRIGFVPPRYGTDVVGGAEAVLSEMAHGLAGRGWDVDVLTTCAKDHVTWANHYPEGESTDGLVTVKRFATQTDTPGKARERIGGQILSGRGASISEQQLWVNDSLRVSGLWHYVLDHADDYRALILGPYMFWTTFAVSQIAPERTILMPCLHDEPPAYLDLFAPCFSGSRGLWFLSEPEAELAATAPSHAAPHRDRGGHRAARFVRSRGVPASIQHRRALHLLRRTPSGARVGPTCLRLLRPCSTRPPRISRLSRRGGGG
ncbi:MAG: hypothetical protein R2706_16625 [Acidimicrobiales bacterium]